MMRILTICLFFLLPSLAWTRSAPVPTDYANWLALHRVYMQARDTMFPEANFSDLEFGPEEYQMLVEDPELRITYYETLVEVENFCEENSSLSACDNLLKVIENRDIQSCFPKDDLIPTEAITRLNNEVATLVLASSRNEFQAYSNSSQVTNMIARMRQNLPMRCTQTVQSACRRDPPPRSRAQCLRYVKLGLIGGGFIRSNPGTASAKDFGPALRRMGFRNLKDDPRHRNMTSRQVPHGAILVYSSSDRRRPHGHIEVYDANTREYLSDYSSRNPIDVSNSRRHLIGIYVK
jgi:hypothetical protein